MYIWLIFLYNLVLCTNRCELIVCDEKPSASRAQILEKIKGVDAAFWATKVRLDQALLDAAGTIRRI